MQSTCVRDIARLKRDENVCSWLKELHGWTMDQAVGGDAYKIFNAITGILVVIRVQMANTRWRGASAQVATMSGRWQAAVLEATNFAKHAETPSLPTDTALPNDLSVNVIHLGRCWRCPKFARPCCVHAQEECQHAQTY